MKKVRPYEECVAEKVHRLNAFLPLTRLSTSGSAM